MLGRALGGNNRVPRLMLVTDRHRSRLPLPDLVAAAVAGGVDAVQVRERDLPISDLRLLLGQLREIIAGRAALLVNREVAVAADLAIGLHLPERGIDGAEARRRLGPDRLLGRSVHSSAGAASGSGDDYLLAGHVYATASKPGRTPLGLAGLRAIAEAAPVPLLAVGGITADRIPAVLSTGAVGVAVIGAIAEASNPEAAAAALRQAIGRIMEDDMGLRHHETSADERTAIVANGKPIAVRPGMTVAGFLAEKGLAPTMAIVERNGQILDRANYDAVVLVVGDQLEVVHAVGGG